MDKLNFVWKNGVAPALNAANLQLITNTINEVIDDNESIHESMALIKSNEVVANPASAPKKVLKSVRIGEITYLVEGGGGSGETEYDLVDSQEGTTAKTMSLPADTKQIVIMAYMNHTYQGVLFEGSAVIDLDSKTITATAPELEEKLYNKYLNQIWRDKGELYHEHQYEYNKISDTEYSFMWMGREGYGTESVTIDGNSIIVNSSYESLGVAIIGVIAGGLQTIDAEFVRIGEKSLQNFFDNGWGFGDVSFTMDSSREETRLRPGIIQVKNILSGNDYSQLWPNKVVVAAYNTNIQILQNDITAYNSVLGEGSVSVLDTIDSLKTSLNDLAKYKKGDAYSFKHLFVAGVCGGGSGALAIFSIPVPKSPIGLTPTLTISDMQLIDGWISITADIDSIGLYNGSNDSINENYISFAVRFSKQISTNNTSRNYRISGQISFS